MSLRDAFTEQLKEAMKAGDKRRLGTIRLIQAALKDRDIEARGHGKERIGEDDILALLQKMIKQRQESAKLYEQGGRADLVQQENEEIAIISGFLPKQMDEAETKAAIAAVVQATGAAGLKDMGKVIAELKARHAGQMDFGRASGLVKAALGG